MFRASQSERIKVKKTEIFYNLLKISAFCVRNGRLLQNYKNMKNYIKR